MTEYNYPSEDELLPNSTYNYDLIPTEQDGSINYTPWVYDQFISLRDTLVYSWKKYNWKWGCLLCVWDKEETVEVLWRNLYRQLYNDLGTFTDIVHIWPYVTFDTTIAWNPNFWNLSWVIQKDGWYRLTYKMEVMPTSTTNKVYTYFDVYRPNWSSDPFPYDLTEPWGTAVFDWECNTSPLTWSTSWTEPNGSCSVSFTLWKLFKKVTAFWYIEKNLKKWDVVVLRAKDAERWANPIPNGNDLTLQASSNYWSIEYLNLPINN